MTDAFTYAELDEILRGTGRNGALGISAIDGLVAALVAAPSFVHPDEWIPLIFGGRQPPLHDNSPELRAVKTIFNRYNEVSETLADRPAAYRPIFVVDDDGRIVARDWAVGFALGIGLCPKEWGSASCSQSTARCSSRSWSTARANSISCRKCRPRKSAGTKPPHTSKSLRPSPLPASSAIPIAPLKRVNSPHRFGARLASPDSRHSPPDSVKPPPQWSQRTAYALSSPDGGQDAFKT